MKSPLIVSAGHITPRSCDYLAAAGQEALSKLKAWRVSVPGRSRVLDAITHLSLVAQTDSYGLDSEELRRTAKAISLVTDIRHIATTLDPSLPGGVMARDLASVLRGSLEGTKAGQKPSSILSQYWFAYLLARSGLRPRVIAESSGRRPDFAISVGTLEFGVEVKRPTSPSSAVRALDSAADQLRAFKLPGVIALDATDCIDAEELVVGMLNDPAPPRDHARPRVNALARLLVDRVNAYQRSDKFSRVVQLVVFARVCGWHAADMSEPFLWLMLTAHPFTKSCGGLIASEIEHIKRALGGGIKDLAVPGTAMRGFDGKRSDG